MVILQDVSYIHPDKDVLLHNISFSLPAAEKIAIVGINGSGKSTLLKIIAGELPASVGKVFADTVPWYVPQLFGQYNELTVAQALKVDGKLRALKGILAGNITDENYALLDDDWTIEEKCKEALEYWQLKDIDLEQPMDELSGGQKTKVFLAAIAIHAPALVLLDEPSNHLDFEGRALLYKFIRSTQSSIILVSHDRALLNLLDGMYELSKQGIHFYGGNYDFYAAQKKLETEALNHSVLNNEKALRKAKSKERETAERQQKLDARGKKKQEKAGVAKIMMNTLRNNAENSTAKTKAVHTEKIDGIYRDLQQLRAIIPEADKIKFSFDSSALHKGKILFKASLVNHRYHNQFVWKQALQFEISSGERIAIKGINGSGKTTLIKMILGKLEPTVGEAYRAGYSSLYIDQDYSLINNSLSVFEQAQQFNSSMLEEHEIKIRLNRFLFGKEDWDKPCSALSGGEKMRLMLCCLTISQQAPDMIILDEPTNNLDIQNIEILTNAISQYQGTLLVVSHDAYFLEQVNMERQIEL